MLAAEIKRAAVHVAIKHSALQALCNALRISPTDQSEGYIRGKQEDLHLLQMLAQGHIRSLNLHQVCNG